jgi:hypothetical protein
MVSFWRNPILRSLLIGVLTVGGTMLLIKQSLPGTYDPEVYKMLGFRPGPFRSDRITIVQVGCAWVALSIIGSYIWHTRRLDRTTAAGKSADALMWLQYILLLLLALFMWMSLPSGEPSTEPFFG